MNEKNTLIQPIVSTKTLIKSTLVASIIALIVFVVFILPAEYNIDPSGIGEALGLTVLAAVESPSPLKKGYQRERARISDR